MKPLTINLPAEVYDHYEKRAAIDDLRIAEGVAKMLCAMAEAHKYGGEIEIPADTVASGRVVMV